MNRSDVITLASLKSCTGCMVCGDVCPKRCISFIESRDGFKYPHIDIDDCICCHLCQKTCPVLNPIEKHIAQPKAYAVWADDEVRMLSASGGAFYVLGERIISEGGYVCGAVFDGYKVKHIITNEVNELRAIQGTKYFQSDVSGIYKAIKKLLKDGKKVLFGGTSCQVAGLLKAVGKNCDNLITIDLICFGVPSALTINIEERIRGKKLKRIISNRDKNHDGGWLNPYFMTCEWDDGTISVSSPNESFMLASFNSGKVMRNSCYYCLYKHLNRQADLTLGDYHNVKDFGEQKVLGVSLVLTHSSKGQLLLKNSGLTIHERDIRECLPEKRTIYYNDTIYARHLMRRMMPFMFKNAPTWLLNISYQNLVKSRNPFVWPLTMWDALYIIINNYLAKIKLKKVINHLINSGL